MRVLFTFTGMTAERWGDDKEPLWADLDVIPQRPEMVDITGLDHELTVVRYHVWYPWGKPPVETPYVNVVLGATLWR